MKSLLDNRVAFLLRLLALVSFCAFLFAAKTDTPADLTLTGPDGARVRLRELRGKVVVLNFWATWCVPCREEMPLLAQAEQTWRNKGIVFIGASLDEKDTRNAIPKFVEKYRLGFPIWTGATGDHLAKFGMGEAVPATAFLDERGIIFARILGQMREGEIDERLRWITAERALPAPAALLNHLGK